MVFVISLLFERQRQPRAGIVLEKAVTEMVSQVSRGPEPGAMRDAEVLHAHFKECSRRFFQPIFRSMNEVCAADSRIYMVFSSYFSSLHQRIDDTPVRTSEDDDKTEINL